MTDYAYVAAQGYRYSFTLQWLEHLDDLIAMGKYVAPRGLPIREQLQVTHTIDMRRPVLNVPERKMNVRLMASEPLWTLAGRNDTDYLREVTTRMDQYSDDGRTLFGAYGPHWVLQLPYVINTLVEDRSSRRAGMTIWRQCPYKTLDPPCTVGFFFGIRGNELNMHVFMRASDVWLGLPYDVFTFSMLAHAVCGEYNLRQPVPEKLAPGLLYLTAATSHVYEHDVEAAREVLEQYKQAPGKIIKAADTSKTPAVMYLRPDGLRDTLNRLRDDADYRKHPWWQQ